MVELPEFNRIKPICRDEGFCDFITILCTLPAGHSGMHVGHGIEGPLAFWNDGDTHPTLVDPLEPTP